MSSHGCGMIALGLGGRMVSIAAGVYVLLGVLHGVCTLYDTVRPTYFAPEDDAVRQHMIATGIRFVGLFGARRTMWPGWLGFNLSHSLGLTAFGGLLLVVDPTPATLAIATGASAAWTAIALRFFFYAPAAAAASATLLFAVALLR